MPESQVMVTLVAVVSVTTGVPGGLGRAVMVTKHDGKRKQSFFKILTDQRTL